MSRLERVVELENGAELCIMQDTRDGELGATVWDAALTLVHSFSPKLAVRGACLDLSCGTGVCGLAAAKVFGDQISRIVFCDVEALIPLVKENVAKNGVACSDDNVMPFRWGDDPSKLKPPFDFILVSDCVVQSYSENYPLLLTSLWELSHDQTVIYLAVELRARQDREFFAMLPQFGFSCQHETQAVHPGFQCEEIRLFRLGKQYPSDDQLY